MRFLTMTKKLRQTPYLQLAIIIFLAAASVGGWLFLRRSESNDGLIAASTASQDKSSGVSELTQKEIEDLLDIEGKFFIELAKFKAENAGESTKLGLYQKYDGSIQEVWSRLDDSVYNRFVLESWYQKDVVGSNREIEFYKGQYFRAMVGPFEPQQAETELNHLVKAGFKDATIRQVMKDDELRPSITHWLLFLYTRNKGPKFTSGWLYAWPYYMEHVTSGNKMLLHPIDTYHGYRNGGTLFLIDGKDGTIREIDDFRSQGFVPLADSNKILVQRKFVLHPKAPLDKNDAPTYPVFPLDKLDKADIAKVANEIGIKPDKIRAQYTGREDSAVISALFEFDMETEKLRSLKVLGGLGGIFRMKDGRILLSDSFMAAYYKGQIPREKLLGIFGHKPYYLFDPGKKKLVRMPDDFVPDSDAVVQPLITQGSDAFTTIAQAGIAKLISFRGSFYIQQQCSS